VRILHAIHDFLPRHRAGSEIYAFELCRALSAAHHVTIVCADYDVSQRHGAVRWRACDGLPVAEIVNNWACGSFTDTYRPPVVTRRLAQVLRAVQPDVLHVHSLLNLSFDLPALARARGIPVVATLHDYTLVCPSGGQRIHRAEAHVCHQIDASRCARCFRESPIDEHISFATLARVTGAPGLLRRAALATARRFPTAASRARRAARRASMPVTPAEIDARLEAARCVIEEIDLLVAPSESIASEFERLGADPSRIRVSDYGFAPLARAARRSPSRPLRIGFVGTLVWHKGVHVLIDAIRALPAGAYDLKIFGDPDVFPDYAAGLRAQAAGLPVRFMGAFSRDRAADVYAQIDVLVVPSLWLENSPLVIHEAFQSGLPVVASRAGGIPVLVDDGRNGVLFEPADSAALARALRPLVDDPSRVAALASAVPRVKSIDEDARAWDAIYTDVARREAPAAQML
jgi:glycosyltransferase involved in cell wall biosynthesis